MSPPKLNIRLLGPLEALEGTDPLDLPPSRKARALLAYLVATGRPHARSALCDLFWQDVDDPRAGLRWALSKLRGALGGTGPGPFETTRDRVAFQGDGTKVDIRHVQSIVPHDPAEASTEALKEAAAAFRGEFVEGLDLPGCHQYEAWSLGRREDLRRLHVSIHATLVQRLRAEPEAALSHALTRLSLDAFNEDGYVAAMELLAETGRMDKGLELYDRCRRMLSEHLGVSPSQELEAARRRLMARPGRRHTPEAAGSVSGAEPSDLSEALARLPEPEHLPIPGEEEPPLVGRATELAAFRDALQRATAQGEGTAILVTGEAGIGKTRLLREWVRNVRIAGGTALSGRIFETEEVRPYGPWIDMLQQLPRSALDAETRTSLTGLLEGSGPRSRTGGPEDRSQIFEATAHLLRRVAEASPPALVVLDDIQWLDTSSVALLHYVVRVLAPDPLVLALAAREEDTAPGSAVTAMVGSLEEASHLSRLALGRLNPADTKSLVHAVDPELDSTEVFTTSEGNPFFTLAVASSFRDGVRRTPATIEEELRHRLDRLEPRARSLLPWAAALGRTFDVPTLVQVVEQPAHEILEALGYLERSGVLRTTGPDRFDFTHSLLREAAYGRPSKPLRRQIHRSIATTLDVRTVGADRIPGAVAHHAELGGLPALSAQAYLEAAEASLWVFAFEEASAMVQRGLAQVEALSEDARIPLEMRLLQLYGFRSMRNHRPEDVEARVRRVTEEARREGMTQVVAKGHACLMELEYQRGAYDDAERSSLRFAEVGRRGEPHIAARALAEAAACLLLLDRDPDDAHRLASEAFNTAHEIGMEASAVALARALLDHHEGRLDSASRGFQEVIRLGRREKDRWWEHPAMTRMIMVELDRGDFHRARSLAEETGALAERMNDDVAGAFARGLGAVAAENLRPAAQDDPDQLGGPDALARALQELRELDSLWRIGQLQSYAAEVELLRGSPAAARERLTEALEAARALQRPSLLALARALLARTCALEGDLEGARRHLASSEVARPAHRLSHRARECIARAREAVHGATVA